jgi:hypothetical protein
MKAEPSMAMNRFLRLLWRYCQPPRRPATLSEALASLPVGLEVSHIPSHVLAHKTADRLGWPYGWFFETSVRVVLNRRLRMEKFGMAAWHEGSWVFSTARSVQAVGGNWPPNCTVFRPGEFEQEFGCPTGWLETGQTYCDHHNWAGSGRLETFRQRWFFIACDEEGHLYKGEGIVELVGELHS